MTERLPEPCLTCGGVCGSYDILAACTCEPCTRCDELDRADAALWLGTTVNPQGGAL